MFSKNDVIFRAWAFSFDFEIFEREVTKQLYYSTFHSTVTVQCLEQNISQASETIISKSHAFIVANLCKGANKAAKQ